MRRRRADCPTRRSSRRPSGGSSTRSSSAVSRSDAAAIAAYLGGRGIPFRRRHRLYDGFALYESAAILEYNEDIHPEPRLFAADHAETVAEIDVLPAQDAAVQAFQARVDAYVQVHRRVRRKGQVDDGRWHGLDHRHGAPHGILAISPPGTGVASEIPIIVTEEGTAAQG